jgi:hypothetical protein
VPGWVNRSRRGAPSQDAGHRTALGWHCSKLAKRWAKRRGRQRFAKLVAERLHAEGELADDIDARSAEAILLAFSAPAFMVSVLDPLDLDTALDVLRRSIAAALLA